MFIFFFLQDSLLHAIKEEYVEAVEVLLEWEENIHVAGEPYVKFILFSIFIYIYIYS